jgi:hypothetical protein
VPPARDEAVAARGIERLLRAADKTDMGDLRTEVVLYADHNQF